jgi:hypothetical protein
LTFDHVGCFPRHAELLSSPGVELRNLGQRRHLTQQADCVQRPFVPRACAPRQLGRPSQLAFDLFEELADLLRDEFRLPALDAKEKRLLLLVRNPNIGPAVDHQRQADNGYEHRDIFAKQPPPNDRHGDPVARSAGLVCRIIHSEPSFGSGRRAENRKLPTCDTIILVVLYGTARMSQGYFPYRCRRGKVL